MSTCVINDGYDLGCFGTGGVKNVYISNYTGSSIFTYDANGVMNTSTGSGTFYHYEADIETAAFNEAITVSRENGTTFYESTIAIKMFNNDANVRNLTKALAKAPLRVLIQDNGDNYWIMGTETSVRATEGSRGFGQAFGDMNGAMLTFSYKSAEPVPMVSGSLVGSSIPTA
jgi:hypothetical protein